MRISWLLAGYRQKWTKLPLFAKRCVSSYPDLEEICRTNILPKRFNFASDVFDQHAANNPSGTALWFENEEGWQRKWSFTQLRTESVKMAIVLRDIIGCTHSEITNPKGYRYRTPSIILVILPRVPEWWSLYLGAIRGGFVFCPATTMLTSEDIAYRLQSSGASAVITDDWNMRKVEEAQRILRGGAEPTTDDRKLRKVLVRPRGKSEGLTSETWHILHELTDEVTDWDILTFKDERTRSEELAQIFFTSGTTGKPKMVAHSHSSYGIGHYKTAKVMGLKQNDVFWNISDTGWAKSSYSNFFAPWMVGSTVYIHQMEKFDSKSVLGVLNSQPITGFCAPPTLYRSLILENDPKLFNFKALRYCCGGGEAINPELSRIWLKKTGIFIHEIYGQTEMTMVAGKAEDPQREGSIGKICTFDLKIIDEDFKEVPQGTEGIVALKVKPTPPVGFFMGYLEPGPGGPVIQSDHPSFSGDYYAFGDRAIMDSDGYLFHLGRSDDVIISAGYRIGPVEVESALQTHESVAESACVPSPDKQRGAIVKAFIVLKEEYKSKVKNDPETLIKDIQNHVKSITAPYKYPRAIEFVDSLPKTISGKILRRELKKKEYEKAN